MRTFFPYERVHEDLLHWRDFLRRVARHLGVSLSVAAVALGIGILGYRYAAGLGWLDAFLNAAMILGGMGPVTPLETVPAKLFAGVYALFAGLVFVGVAGMLLAPFLHRLLHEMHMDFDQEPDE